MRGHPACLLSILLACLLSSAPLRAQLLDKLLLLDAQTFWDNRDWDWYCAQIPFFECPDPDITTTYYYRWELLTKHLTYGSPNSGYSFTEFIDRPFWSGAYGAISCPAGHQLYEARWLHDPRFARDYARYWLRTPGAQPRRYSTWLADSVWALQLVHPHSAYTLDLLPDLIRNYEGWEQSNYVPEARMFWQNGHDDGMEFNINSRQTQDILRGAPGFRPSFNAYMFADARAIARIAALASDQPLADAYTAKAEQLKQQVQQQLWDPRRQFFFHMFRQDEERDGHVVKARTLTHQTGQFAASDHGRELIGYVPWQFDLPDPGYESAWKVLMDREFFRADFGPTTVERRDPLFYLSPTCCWWSGQSWPYATTQTLKALANLLQHYDQQVVSHRDYLLLLQTFARTHRKEGRPYLAEACHPDTGSWDGHDGYNHSEHYFHSGYCDLIITGLAGLQPRGDEVFEVYPLAPPDWDYFGLDDLAYHGHRVGIVWDRTGRRYGLGAGLHLLVDGRKLASAPRLERLRAALPRQAAEPTLASTTPVNWAVNNDGTYYPRVEASFTAAGSDLSKLNDGNYWYHVSPPNRWTTADSPLDRDWVVLDFGVPRLVHTVKAYVLDDGQGVVPPQHLELETWDGQKWQPVREPQRAPANPTGRRANVIRFAAHPSSKLRLTLVHAAAGRSGLTELEAWGDAQLPVSEAPPPAGNLAHNPGGQEYPKASASHTSRFDRVEAANDGRIVYGVTPNNRWTSYESPRGSDWLEIDFGQRQRFARVELAIFDDRGGVQAPESYAVEYWAGDQWTPVSEPRMSPARPRGGVINTVSFEPVESSKVRIVFTHRNDARSGVTEILVWPQ